uniref:Zinc finger and BTB domain containing 33 n=1 Tax=Tetraodon nigroviridis TaxID=99883 RepID=H3DE99_TETNG
MSGLKLISVTDTQYPEAVLKSLNEQRSHGLFCDVTIIIQDKKFRAHKTVLSASSTYFYQLFTVAGQVIELNFIRAEIFEEILNYIYSAKICRIRSDLLEELISAGQMLGVEFIAKLASPLSQIKGLPGLSKETESKSDASAEVMPIITESFSLSAEEFKQTSGDEGPDEDSDSDVMFVSQTRSQSKGHPDGADEVIDVDSEKVPSKPDHQSDGGSVHPGDRSPTPAKTLDAKPPVGAAQSPSLPTGSPLRSPTAASVALPPESTRTLLPRRRPGPTKSSAASQPPESRDIPGVHKKQISTSCQEGNFKITLKDVSEVPPSPGRAAPPSVAAVKTVTLNAATEIDSFSTGCKVYANIGENTYDIVPVKEDPGEGGSRSATAPPASPKASPNRKRSKAELEDHYELIMDGKTFYVCVVCKRPYVCLTSLRRHFNTHSWEKKYPCRYCHKVFALAEYRTKHELQHTGERRYQCLLCNGTFLNYQILATHCKSVHNQDPSGRKEKEDKNNHLYRLLPCKAPHAKPYPWSGEGPGFPVISEDGRVHHVGPAGQEAQGSAPAAMLNWDDIFALDAPPKQATEFDFVIPETY